MDMEKLASILEAVKVLELKPMDALVFRCRDRLSDEESGQAKEFLSVMFPDRKILILDAGADVEVLRAPEVDEAFVADVLVPAIRKAIDERDLSIIGRNSKQAADLKA